MIRLNRLNNKEVIINSDLIEMMEETPDLIITLTTGKKITVTQTPEEVIDKVVAYKTRFHNGDCMKK